MTAFADSETKVVDDSPLGVITDANGNIVEVLTVPRAVPSNGKYVDSICTIPAHGTLTSYQYKPKEYIEFAFACYADDETTLVTTRNGEITLQLLRSATIGGTRSLVYGHTFSTNYEDITTVSYVDGTPHAWAFVNETDYHFDSSMPYYNGKYINESDFAITLRILIWMDP
ncbi:MAG: hypothetical protein ACI4JS_09495 [Oscillospiraceae bacterium]